MYDVLHFLVRQAHTLFDFVDVGNKLAFCFKLLRALGLGFYAHGMTIANQLEIEVLHFVVQ